MAAKRTHRAGLAALALLASAALGLTACTDASPSSEDAEVSTIGAGQSASIDAAIASALQLSGADSAIVGIWSGAGDYVRGYGDGISASSQFRAAQASQPVMCALLLDLVAEGTLSLDRPISRDLPRQLGIEGITYGMLCDATSGLADYKTNISDIFANNPTRPWSDRELFVHSLAHSPLAEPGTEQHISDINSILLARAISQHTGESISTLLEERVFMTSGMQGSYYPGDIMYDVTLPGGGMNGYTYPMASGAAVCSVTTPVEGGAEGEVVTTPIEPRLIERVSPSMLSGAGATVTTVTDLKRFYERYVAGGFDSAGATNLVTSPWAPAAAAVEGETTEPVEAVAAAESWSFGLERHGNLFGMSGAMTGTLTAVYHDPNTGFTVIVAVNNSSAGAQFVRTLAFQLAAIAGAGVEWTAEDQAAVLTTLAVCQPPAEVAEEAPVA